MEAHRDSTGVSPAGEHPAGVDADAERLVDGVDGDVGEVVVGPLDAPIETPLADLIDQRRSVRLDEADER